jgi:hypothetical protein
MYSNVGTADSMAFAFSDTLCDNSGDILSEFDLFFRMDDLGGDDTLDLFLGIASGSVRHYKNIGSPEDPLFQMVEQLAGVHSGSNNRAIPFLTDIDDDEDLDLFVGRFLGGIKFYRNSTTTAVENIAEILPRQFKLEQNNPNPFNPLTHIRFFIPNATAVTLNVYNILGEKVQTVVSENLQSGSHTYLFDRRQLATGVYFYKLTAGEYQQTKKMILIK